MEGGIKNKKGYIATSNLRCCVDIFLRKETSPNRMEWSLWCEMQKGSPEILRRFLHNTVLLNVTQALRPLLSNSTVLSPS